MAINILNESFPLCTKVCQLKSDFSTECDIIVPDAKPDISRVLQLSARAKITSCETQSDRVILSGTVFFNILYLADNEEKSVKAIDASCPFSNLFLNNEIRENMFTVADIDVAEISCNLTNCRKLTAKAILSGQIRVYSSDEIVLVTDIEGACKKGMEISSTVICAHAEEVSSITDSFELSQNKASISEILKADAKINDTDIKVIDNKAIVKGSLCVTTLYRSESGLDFIESEVPFAQVLDAEGITPDMLTNYDVKLFDLTVTSAPNSVGDIRAIDINAELFFRVIAEKNCMIKCISDAYLPHGALNLNSTPLSVSGVEKTLQDKISLREIITLPSDCAPIGTIYQIVARPICEVCENVDGKLNISGYTEVYILYLSPDEDSPIYSHKANIDFALTLDSPDCSILPSAECRLGNINYIINDERSVEVRMIINVSTRCARMSETDVITSASEAQYSPQKRSSIIVSFVNDGRSLWDIAKKYNIDEADILHANAYENKDELTLGAALIIPK